MDGPVPVFLGGNHNDITDLQYQQFFSILASSSKQMQVVNLLLILQQLLS
jgi:hypothetical protein